MKAQALLILFLILAICLYARRAQCQKHSPPEQRAFSAEDASVETPIPIPADVMELLRNDSLVKNVMESQDNPPQNLPASWFSAGAVHLGPSKEMDLVVVAEPPLAGGNVTTFWVFRATTGKHELVLNAPAHNLIIKTRRTNGYRDIELVGMTAVEVTTVQLRFDGRGYREYRSRSELIR